MPEFEQAFEELSDTDTWYNVALTAGGYMGSELVKNTIEGRVGVEVPDEAYGVVVIAVGAAMLDGQESRQVIVGGGLNTISALAQRLGVVEEFSGGFGV